MKVVVKTVYFSLAWLCFAVGLLGAFLPALPTTPFMLLALWLWAKSSPRFHAWLYHHPVFGPPLQQWETGRVIPLKAKVLAVSMMLASFTYLAVFAAVPLWLVVGVALFMVYAAWFILSKPSQLPPT